MADTVPNRILVLDDEEAYLSHFTRLLESRKFSVVPFLNGQQALSFLGENPTGWLAIISDFRMPEMNGLSFLRKVVEQRFEASHIVLMSSFFGDDSALVKFRSDMSNQASVSYIEKPDSDLLIETLQRKK